MGPGKIKRSKKTSRSLKSAAQIETRVTKDSSRKNSGEELIPGSWKRNLLVFLLLVLATLLLYSPDLHLGFFSVDDPGYILNNPRIKEVSAENIRLILSEPFFANYSPVHLFSFMVDYAFSGPDAYGFHLSSNLWAGLVAGLVFLIALALTRQLPISVLASLLFVVHPTHVEAVAWISSRKDLVATAFALPSLLAYIRYRRGNLHAKKWYLASVLFFLIAVAGKLSVATFPAVFLVYDICLGSRSFLKSLPDKIPYLAAEVTIALIAASAQPSFGNRPDPYVLLSSTFQNFWLLTGFGDYVLYRVSPYSAGIFLKFIAAVLLLFIFIVPFLFRKKFPLTVLLTYWILFAFIPTQVLSFTHPVTDRYLFFPSVASCILLVFLFVKSGERLGKWGFRISIGLTLTIGIFWTVATRNYLAEWDDPRSIWYPASKKTSDPVVFQNLGTFYLDKYKELDPAKISNTFSIEENKQLASLIWRDNSLLTQLYTEWDSGKHGGPAEQNFREELKKLSWQAYEQSLNLKGNRVMAGLYYNRGLLLLNSGEPEAAKKEFLTALEEVTKESFSEVRAQLTIYCQVNMGIIAWRENDHQEALKWFRLAEDEQTRAGRIWMPDISTNRKKLEELVATKISH